ncbi:MAG: FAD-dependent oxidoreductase [Desulfobacula sp.]|nr:FAD-dependent oxidoreductase [Desulfobacula sp.]
MEDILFTPVTINKLTLKNRLYMLPMWLGLCENNEIGQKVIDFYEERAKGGVGMIAAGFATVNDLAQAPVYGGHDDRFLPGLSVFAGTIKQHDCAAVMQINHAGANAYLFDGRKPVSASNVPGVPKVIPEPLTLEGIQQTIADFGETADRMKRAGFDAVEILAATGYLISQFLSPVSNKRTDDYGGPIENRMRFGIEVARSVRAAVGKDYPIIVRINGHEFMKGGLTREESQLFAKRLVEEGRVDCVNVNVGWHQAYVPQITANVPRGVWGYLSRGIRENVNVPVVASHRIPDPATGRRLLNDHMCDIVGMGRSLISDPYLPEKARMGKEDRIVTCIACAQGCFDAIPQAREATCLCNPRVGRERTTAAKLVSKKKRVMVVGGGAAGMNAALAAAEQGHLVSLFESDNHLGGQLHLAGAPPGREEFKVFANVLARQIEKSPVKLHLNTKVTPERIEAEKPDAVVVTTGAVPAVPPIIGVNLPHVVQAWDVLAGKAITGERVVVVGGGAVGVETALFLAEKGALTGDMLKFLMVNRAENFEKLYQLAIAGTKKITLVEMFDKLGRDIGPTTRWGMLKDVKRSGIIARTDTIAREITPDGIRVAAAEEETELILADTIVLASGAKSYNPLEKYLETSGIPYQVAGDALQIARAMEAVQQGFDAGHAI